jgi:succinate dehydrogenase / fumarate reductase cytochrome b subunit
MSETPEKTKTHSRPLSPHLQVYNLPMTARMSITHRFTGIVLSGGMLIVGGVLVAAAMGPTYYDRVMGFAASDIGTGILFLWSLALFYHLCNGLRHLLWDMVLIFKLRNARIANWVVIFMALGLTISTWYCAQHFGGNETTTIEGTTDEQ